MRNAMIFIFALALIAHAAFADISVSNATTLPSSVRPGVAGTISMTVSNPDTYDALGVIGESFGTDDISTAGRTGLGDFKSGVSSILSFPFSVPATTKAGIYTIRYTLSWTNVNGSRYKTLYLPIVVSNPPIFSIDSEDKAVFTNSDFNVSGTLFNSGGKATAVRIQANSDKVIQTGQNPLWVGDVNKSAAFQMSFAVAPGTSSGRYLVPVSIIARDEIGQESTYNATLRVSITRRAPSFGLAATADKPLNPGVRATLTLTLANTGDDDAYLVKMALPEDSAFTPIGVTSLDVGTLKAGESRTVDVEVGVNNVAPGFYTPKFTISYKNMEGEAQPDKNVSVGINIEGKNDVSVFISAKPAPLVAGGSHTLSILVSNVGSSPIKALTVEVGDGFFSLQEAQATQFIGGLNEDDFSTVQYKVRVDDGIIDGNYPFNVTMTFKDSYNNEHNITKTEQIYVLSKQTAAKLAGGDGGISPLVMVVALGAIAFAGYYGYKRFKGKPKAKQ